MSKPAASAKLSSSNQLSLPKAVREHLKAKQGDLILFFIRKEGEVVMKTMVE